MQSGIPNLGGAQLFRPSASLSPLFRRRPTPQYQLLTDLLAATPIQLTVAVSDGDPGRNPNQGQVLGPHFCPAQLQGCPAS